MRMYEQGCTPSDMEEYDRMSNERWTYVAPSYERACSEAFSKSYNTTNEDEAEIP